MPEDTEYRCFVGGLAWSTSDRGLKVAFEKYGNLVEAKVVVDKFSGRSRGFGFVTFDEKKALEEAIEEMNGMDLDGRTIIVEKAQPSQGSGRDHDSDRSRDRGGDRGGNGGDCFKCGKPGHFARECPSGEGARGGGRYGDRDDDSDRSRDRGRDRGSDYESGGRRGGNGGDCFKCGKPGHFARECPSGEGARGGDRYGDRDERYGGGSSRDGSRYGPDRNGDRHGGRSSRDGGSRGGEGSDRYSRDRSDERLEGAALAVCIAVDLVAADVRTSLLAFLWISLVDQFLQVQNLHGCCSTLCSPNGAFDVCVPDDDESYGFLTWDCEVALVLLEFKLVFLMFFVVAAA
ncbi:unnamed protein product [Linum tenue]|uniref:Uncharacterized protein n=1 Tax=Linum tenue TaxID=586396 RepID=A0AAV0LXH4_9ROSI|nr:unnamed protein product [Linum tenue]